MGIGIAAQTFEDLVVWQKAHAYVLSVYQVSKDFPREEKFGLAQQLRRAAVSVPANIAEGFKKRGRPEKARFMNIAQGSLEESRYYLRLAGDLGYAPPGTLAAEATEIGRLLNGYARALMSR